MASFKKHHFRYGVAEILQLPEMVRSRGRKDPGSAKDFFLYPRRQRMLTYSDQSMLGRTVLKGPLNSSQKMTNQKGQEHLIYSPFLAQSHLQSSVTH